MEITKETPIKVKRRECIKRIKEILTKIGPWNINIKSLAEEFHIEWRTADKLFKSILRNMPEEAVNDLRIRFEQSFKKAMEHIEIQLADPNSDADTRDKAIKNLNLTIMNFTKFLEEWNRKEKIADKTQIEITNAQVEREIDAKREEFRALPIEMQDKFLKLMRRRGNDQ